jgi:diguanylate cyclase (GGDEF)-like protein
MVRLLDRRYDGPLAAGLIAGTFVVFQQPLRWLLDQASDIQDRYRLDLIPALVVLSVVFVLHQYRKRQEVKAEAMASAAEARAERERVTELEQLVTLGRSLANSLDFSAVRQAIWRHLPGFLRTRALWVVLRERNQWRTVIEDTDTADRTPPTAIENIAALALARGYEVPAGESAKVDGYECFAMGSGDSLVGMLVLRQSSEQLTDNQRRALEAALAFLAIAIRNVQLLVETRENSMRDSLTQWFNRGHGVETLRAELQRSKRNGTPVSLLMFDVDRFKTLNDRYGHQAGDAVLMSVARHVTDLLRASDVKCRYGGDEFMVILPETPAAGAHQVAEHIRRAVASLHMPVGSDMLSVTTSIGATTSHPGELDAEAVIARADAALYGAKRAGRNAVNVDRQEPAEAQASTRNILPFAQ